MVGKLLPKSQTSELLREISNMYSSTNKSVLSTEYCVVWVESMVGTSVALVWMEFSYIAPKVQTNTTNPVTN